MTMQTFVESFDVTAPTGNQIAGLPITLSAAPGEVLDEITQEVVTAPLDLSLVAKHVQIPAEPGEVPWPHDAPATNVVTSITSGLSSAPAAGNLEGWIARLTGDIPVGLRDISDQVRIDLRWRFTDPVTSEELDDVEVLGGAPDAESITIAIPPVVAELTTDDFATALDGAPVTRRIGVQLSVHGRIGTTVDESALVPEIPIEIPIVPIPLPTVAALFRDSDLRGDAVLLMVPGQSPLSSAEAVVDVVAPLRALLNTVNAAAVGTSWATGTRGLLSSVTALADRIPLTKHVGFLARDEHNNLGKYNFIERRWVWDLDIEDRGSSTVVVSVNRQISYFEHDDFKGHELAVNPTPNVIGHFGGAAIRHLHTAVPQSEPPGCVAQTGSPGGSWGDKISSYRWSAAPVGIATTAVLARRLAAPSG